MYQADAQETPTESQHDPLHWSEPWDEYEEHFYDHQYATQWTDQAHQEEPGDYHAAASNEPNIVDKKDMHNAANAVEAHLAIISHY
ncbi:MAG: hypothetical protein M1826_004585 [Phylliscum demangeonii]|nr:MAG: hypothetical protein M1826_004585 [Phylliscum demangeonii]